MELKLKITKKSKLKFFSSIIYYLKRDLRPREISQKLNWSEQRLNYNLNLMKDDKYIKRGIKTSYREWIVTDRGENLLKEFLSKGEISLVPLNIRLHLCNFQFVFAKLPEIPLDFRECKRKNHTDYLKKQDNVELEIITGKRPNFLIRIHSVYGNSREDCRSKAYWFAYTIAQKYCEDKNFKLLLPPIVKEEKWSWGIPNPDDPTLKKILKEGKQTIQIDGTEVTYDESLGKGISEIEFKGEQSGELAEGYATLPKVSTEILKELKEQREMLKGTMSGMTSVQNAILLVSQNITQLQKVILKKEEIKEDGWKTWKRMKNNIN